MSLFSHDSIHHTSVSFAFGMGVFMPSATDGARSAQILPQVPLRFTRLAIQKAFVALAIAMLPASALLPGSQAAAQVTASPSSISWYKVAIGNTGGGKSATLTNSGSSAISISGISITGTNSGDFYIAANNCGTSLAAFASCTLSVYFRPVTVGTRTATLTYIDNASNSPQQVFLSGLGTSVSATPGSLFFGSVSAGSKSATQTITVSNGTANSVTLSSGSISGANPAVFAVTSTTCGSTLAASASCTASIAFTPAAAVSYAATWTITAGSNPLSVVLSGTGTSVSVSPTSVSWYKVAVGNTGGGKSVTLTNNASSAISISSISITGINSSDFYIAANNCGTSLAAYASCTLSVYFRPVTVGTRTAMLTYIITASSTPLSVPLSGTGTRTYYVSNCGTVGSDSNNGTSPSTPWLTIAKVNSSTFNPGDTIEFHDGCTWREELNLPSSGTATYPITVSTYGLGNPPIISGSQVITSWTDEAQSSINFTSDHSLQAYWSMDQMSGSSFLDSTSNGNTLTNINGVTQNTNHVQGSYSANFDPVQGMELSRSDSTLSAAFPGKNGTTNTSITAGGWIYFDSSNANGPFIFKGTWELFKGTGPSLGKMNWQIFINSANHCVQSNNGNLLTPDAWYHVVGRVNGSTGEQALFIDGAKQTQTYNTGGAALSTDTTALQIAGNGSNFFDGKVDELFVFNRPLSDSEIARIYTSGLNGSGGSYMLYYTGANASPLAVYENGAAMSFVAQKTGMTPGSWYWDAANARVYIRPTGDVDPSTETFEIPQRLTCITDSRNYTTITGLTCQEPMQKGVFVTGTNVTVQNMLINNVRENGPNSPNLNADGVGVFWEGNNDTIQNNTVANANWGIFSDAQAGQTIAGLIQGNTVYNIGYDGIGITVSERTGGVVSNTIVQSNVLHDIGIYNLQGGAIECILAGPTPGTGNILRYNLIYSIGNARKNAFPMNVQGGAGGCAFYGNVVHDSYGPCMSVLNGPGGNRFYNNTCYNNGLAGGQGAGIYIDGGSADTGNVFENNIIYAGPNTTFTFVMAGSTSSTLDDNLYYGGTATPFTWNGTAYSMANYLAASGQDAHSVNADPLFTSPSTNDFSLTSNSPAIGAGVYLGPTYQLDLAPGSVWPFNVSTANQSTNGAWDIGAYVFPQ
jgi:Concanavalin A-like lectin/glucanases superfamily